MAVVTLPPLGTDFSQYMDPVNPININHAAVVAVKDQTIQCSGLILSLRSSVFKDMLLEDNEIFLTEFDDVIDHVYECLQLLYGGCISISEKNVFPIYKFGFLYKIESMKNLAMDWLMDYVQPVSFWNHLVKFQRYQCEVSLNVFTSIADKLLKANSPEFVKENIRMLMSCKEMSELKCILRFMFSRICYTHLELMFKVFQTFLDKGIDNDLQEYSSEIFLDCMDEKVDAMAKHKFDGQILLKTFQVLQGVVSTNSNLRKLSAVQLKVFAKIPPAPVSYVSETNSAVGSRPGSSNSTSQSHAQNPTNKTAPATSSSVVNVSSNKQPTKTSDPPNFEATLGTHRDSNVNLQSLQMQSLQMQTSHSAIPSEVSQGASHSSQSPRYNTSCASDMIPSQNVYSLVIAHALQFGTLTGYLIESMTSKNTPKMEIIQFCQGNLFPSYYLIEIGLEFINQNRSCSFQVCADILKKAKELPKRYFDEIVKASLHFFGIFGTSEIYTNNLQLNGSKYSYYEWKLDTNRIRQMDEGKSIWFHMPCEVPGCVEEGHQLVMFQYDERYIPSYRSSDAIDYTRTHTRHNHKDNIKHWIMMYRHSLDKSDSDSETDVSDDYIFSFVTEKDDDGNDFDCILRNILRSIERGRQGYSVWLGCLYSNDE